MIDFAELKRAMQGREIEFARQYLTEKQLNGRNQPCPSCGGTDRFRLIDKNNGSFYCSTFENGAGDIFSLIAHTQNMNMKDVFREALIFAGLDNATDIDRARAKKRRDEHLEKLAAHKKVKSDRVYLSYLIDRMLDQISHTKGAVDEPEIQAARDLVKFATGFYGSKKQSEKQEDAA